jgi:hypothetical protein
MMLTSSCSSLATNIVRWHFRQYKRIEKATISISVEILYCSSVSPRTEVQGKGLRDLASYLLSLAFICSTSGAQYRESMFIKARANVSAQAFVTEGMSTRIGTSN